MTHARAQGSRRHSLTTHVTSRCGPSGACCADAVGLERDRLAHRINDEVIRRLFATGLHLQTTAAMVDATARLRLQAAIDDLDSAIIEIRKAIFADLEARGPTTSSKPCADH